MQQAGVNLTPAFAAELAASRSWRTAADIYAAFAESVSASPDDLHQAVRRVKEMWT